MLPMFLRNKEVINKSICSLALFLMLSLTLPVYALDNVTGVSVQNTLVNIANQVPVLMSLATALAYVMGMVFIMMGIIKLRHVGEMRTMMSHEHGVSGPLVLLAIGAMLLYLPTAVSVGMSTFWSNPNPYGYLQQQDQWQQFINDCYLIVQLVGTIAFIRGLVIWSHLGGQGQQGSLGRGLTFVIGGILCINIYQFVQIIFTTLGIQTS